MKNSDLYHSVYKEIFDLCGEKAMLEIFEMFKGQQITFPLRLYSMEYVKDEIVKNFNGSNAGELAKKFDYSENTVRRIYRENIKKST